MSSQRIVNADSRDYLRLCKARGVRFHAAIQDPPYELDFMGQKWDGTGIAFDSSFWRLLSDCLYPGAFLLAFGGTRTYHRIAVAIEDAGFELRDTIAWCYGSGFPKSLNVGNGRGTALKPAFEPIIVARKPLGKRNVALNVLEYGTGAINIDACRVNPGEHVPGGGTFAGIFGNGQPANHEGHELGRWPSNLLLTHSASCQRVGTRVVKAAVNNGSVSRPATHVYNQQGWRGDVAAFDYADEHGNETVPAYDCAPDCPVAEMDRQSGNRPSGARKPTDRHNVPKFKGGIYHDYDGGNTDYEREASEGGASRFFTQLEYDADLDCPPFLYTAKAGKGERNAMYDEDGETVAAQPHNLSSNACARCGLRVKANGSGKKCECGDLRETVQLAKGGNHHPTVKPTSIFTWLLRLALPTGGTFVDPFLGSGTSLVAARRLGVNGVGIELSAEYAAIARARLAAVQPPLFGDVE